MQNKTCKLIYEHYFNGWTNITRNEQNKAKYFKKLKNDIEISDGLIYYNTGLIVRKVLKKHILK